MSTAKICTQCGAEFGPEQRFCPTDGTPLRPTGNGDPLVGQVIADRYQVLELLGEGGMGRVYLAEHVRMGRKSAVKVMSPNLALSAEAISRFNREASNASRINHPNVAQIYDFGETTDGMLYLAMEFVEGETLRRLIERDGRMPTMRAAGITKQVADALAAAHHLGIVHRDLKPDNVMIARHHDGSDWVKVVDFGIAKTVQGSGEGASSQTVTTAGVSLGTPEYMSPEQLSGERLDSRTDLYSLGLVLFNMLTAELPYPRVTSKETLVRRLTSRPRSLADVAPSAAWPTKLQAALDRALAPEPKDRYATVADFGRDVVAAATDDHDADLPTVRLASVPPMSSGQSTRPVVASPARAVKQQPSAKPNRTSLIVAGVVLLIAAGAAGAFVASRAHSRVPRPVGARVDTAIGSVATAPPPAATEVVSSAAPVKKDSTPVATKDTARAADSARIKSLADSARELKARVDSLRAAKTRVDTVHPPAPAPAPAPASPSAAATAIPQGAPSPATPTNDSARRGGGGGGGGGAGGGRRGAMGGIGGHAWLRANGDSGAVPLLSSNASDADRINLVLDEIRGHMARAYQYLSTADVQHVRGELRDAQTDIAIMHQIYPVVSDSLRVDQQARQAAARIFQSCPAFLADTTKHFPPNFKCEQLLGGFGRGRQGQGGLVRRPPLPR